MNSGIKFTAFAVSVIMFFIVNVILIWDGFKYSQIYSSGSFTGSKFELLIFLVTIGGYILLWLGFLGLLILTYLWKKAEETTELSRQPEETTELSRQPDKDPGDICGIEI